MLETLPLALTLSNLTTNVPLNSRIQALIVVCQNGIWQGITQGLLSNFGSSRTDRFAL